MLRRPWVALFFGALAVLIACVNYWGWEGRFYELPAVAYSGDEPHYLMVINSLLTDHDLDLTDDYRRVARGGWEAGRRFRGAGLDHHTVLVDRTEGRSLLWQEVFDWRVRECREFGCEGFRRLRPDFPPGSPRSEISAHPIGFPALIALLLAPIHPTPQTLEAAVNRLFQLLCWVGALLTYATVIASGGSRKQGLVAAGLLALCSPWLPYSRSFFVELPAGVLLIAGVLALQRGRPVWAGIAVGLAFTMKPLFLLFGVGWMIERLLAQRWKDALRIAIPLGAIGLATAVYNEVAGRRLVIAGASQWKWAEGLNGLHAQLFDAAHGALPFAPWILLAFLPWLVTLCQPREARALHLQIALPAALYGLTLVANQYLGETCYGPRYWVPVLPLLAVLASETLNQLPRRVSLACLVLLGALGLSIAIPAALRYPGLWDQDAKAAWKVPRGY
jgi:hypothetical protein